MSARDRVQPWVTYVQLQDYRKGDRVTVVTGPGNNPEVMTVTQTISRHLMDYKHAYVEVATEQGKRIKLTVSDVATQRQSITWTPYEVGDHGRPLPGDAVRLASEWRWAGSMVAVGDIGVIGGIVGQYPEDGTSSITFKASVYRDGRGVSCSGGPATIATDLSQLKPTGERVTLQAWQWRDGYVTAHNGRYYSIEVPLWDWHPREDE